MYGTVVQQHTLVHICKCVLSTHTHACKTAHTQQAVGIFGHMTANNPLDPRGGGGPTQPADGTKKSSTPTHQGEAKDEVGDNWVAGVTAEATQDLDTTLEKLSASIDEALSKSTIDLTPTDERGGEATKEAEPHFTIATSSTRFDDTSRGPKQ